MNETKLPVFLTLPLVLLASTGCRRGEAAEAQQAPIPVLVRAVSEPSDTSGARYSGTIEPATRVDIAFKVSGYLREVLQVRGVDGKLRKVQEGDVVAAGTVLAVVREGDYLQKVAAAKAQLAQALANVSQAQLDYDRSKRLVAENVVPVAQFDSQSSKLATAKALVQEAQAQEKAAQLLLNDTTLRAPITGVILKRVVEPGTFVTAGTPGFTIADIKTVKFVFGAPDGLLDKLTLGTRLNAHVDALDTDVDCSITRISPSADMKSHVFEIETTIQNAAGRLKPGFVASLAVPEGAQPRAIIALPLTGVVRSPGNPRGFAVFVVGDENGTTVARLRDVKLGSIIGNEVQVLSGLKKADRIVSLGATLLVDGSRVRILPG